LKNCGIQGTNKLLLFGYRQGFSSMGLKMSAKLNGMQWTGQAFPRFLAAE
jgi:hypothetical protein